MGQSVRKISDVHLEEAYKVFNDFGTPENWRDLVDNWKVGFTERILSEVNSKKRDFNLSDAIKRSKGLRKRIDDVMIQYVGFIGSNPLDRNDYFKYVSSYQNGKTLPEKFFRHDIKKLHKYYREFDKDGEHTFNKSSYERYVLFMMLKLEGLYRPEFDVLFKVKSKNHREYNPLANLPGVLRGELPFKVKEYDIKRAYPTFIDNELGLKRKEDVYSLIDKDKFLRTLNLHSENEDVTIDYVRDVLRPIYKDRIDEVVTEKRFFQKGGMFNDIVKYEEEAINKFVEANGLQNYVRLHDGIFVKENVECSELKICDVEFTVKECIKPEIVNTKKNFYHYDSEGALVTSEKLYHDWFLQEDFIRASIKGNDTITIFKGDNKIIDPVNHKTDIVPMLKADICEFDDTDIQNRLAKDNRNVIPGGLILMKPIPLEYYQDDEDSFGLAFNNGFFFMERSKDGIKRKEYKDVNGFFPPHHTQSHEFEYTDEVGDFEKFVMMVSTGIDSFTNLKGNDTTSFSKWRTMIGYCVHGFKDPSDSIAQIFSDKGANDESRNGGRGKSILAGAFGYVQKSMIKGGDEFDPKYRHVFAELNESHRIYVIDDVPPNFPYDSIYTNITGDITCQLKGVNAVSISKERTPKFIITTNWSVRYDSDASSTNRRFYEWQFSDYFNLENTPKKVFGRKLFIDWDKKEWDRFYSFIFRCVKEYFIHGLRPMEYDKTEDNFRANFNNDAFLDEFERIFNNIKDNYEGFSVSDFLNQYKDIGNRFRFEGWFHKNNVKRLMNDYIEKNQLEYKYRSDKRKWVEE
ncbi:hypothetical protein [Maribacter flavus]|uniref:Uncharacterized protein n=1 Tax=Maribacter flavus TaxID=1658664 RepID=A0A5B2TVY9_9FLAO|nr:hypothetical protein [Maribacter flavus]KAA2218544.1 hypothetical protein F0361_02675 [Maribacter flavus]